MLSETKSAEIIVNLKPNDQSSRSNTSMSSGLHSSDRSHELQHEVIFTTNPEKQRPAAPPADSDNGFFLQAIANANKLASIFEGSVLTDKVLSICKAQESVKFKCQNGHVFYKSVDSLKIHIKHATGRKHSASTAASASLSSDDEASDAAHLYGCWCPKCEEFYAACNTIAKQAGFRLDGKLYSKILNFRCAERKHCTPISYNKRISQSLSCQHCKREQKEALKEKLRQEEEQQSKYISQMQEQMFRKAREEMEKELKNNFFDSRQGFNGHPRFNSYSHDQSYDSNRLAAIE